MRKIFAIACLAVCLSSPAFAAFNLSGDELDFDMESNLGVAKGNVILEQDGARATGDYAQFNNKTRTGYLQGHVVADKDGYHITADTMTVHSDDHTSASGKAVLTKDGRKLESNLINYYKSSQIMTAGNGRSTLTDTDGSTVQADNIEYDNVNKVATATGNVNIKSDVKNLTASADKAIYRTDGNTEKNYLELIGNATATQDGNTVRGNRLKLNNARVASADGRVSIDFIPKEQPKAAAAPATEENKTTDKPFRRVRAYPDAPEEA